MNQLVRLVQVANHLRQFRQQAARGIARIHPAQLDGIRRPAKKGGVHDIEPGPENTVSVDCKLVALRQDECRCEDRHKAVLHAERRLAPFFEQLGQGDCARSVVLAERGVPHRKQAARIVTFGRRDESPAAAVAGIESCRLQQRGKQPALGRKSLNSEALSALVQEHPFQQRVLRRDGASRGLLPTQQLVMQPRRLVETAVRQIGGEAIQVGMPQMLGLAVFPKPKRVVECLVKFRLDHRLQGRKAGRDFPPRNGIAGQLRVTGADSVECAKLSRKRHNVRRCFREPDDDVPCAALARRFPAQLPGLVLALRLGGQKELSCCAVLRPEPGREFDDAAEWRDVRFEPSERAGFVIVALAEDRLKPGEGLQLLEIDLADLFERIAHRLVDIASRKDGAGIKKLPEDRKRPGVQLRERFLDFSRRNGGETGAQQL